MPRRTHKKSRHGCQECKRRHLKCDETRPKCINCVTAQLRCPYEAETRQELASPYSRASSSIAEPSTSSASTPTTSPAGSATIFPSISPDGTDAPLNMLHLELLHHWSSGLDRGFHITLKNHELYGEVCIKHGLKQPFLMRQMLATSALHMSVTRLDQRMFYHQHATQLQTQALAEFGTIFPKLDESNIISAFLMSSLIGLYAFCETFAFRDDNFNHVLDSLISCISLLRGVRSVMGGWWHLLLSSEVGPILVTAHELRLKSECQPYQIEDLRKLVNVADVSPSSKQAYDDALKELELNFAVQNAVSVDGTTETAQTANMLMAWLVIIPKGYVENLSARRPEALIILAYYAVLLHRRKGFWAIGDAGEFLINGIGAYLGKHWDEWLSTPRSVIAR